MVVRCVASPCPHLPHAGCGGLDFHGPIQYHAAQVDAVSAIRSKGMAMENMALHGFELVRPPRMIPAGVRVPLDLFIEIEAMVVTPA